MVKRSVDLTNKNEQTIKKKNKNKRKKEKTTRKLTGSEPAVTDWAIMTWKLLLLSLLDVSDFRKKYKILNYFINDKNSQKVQIRTNQSVKDNKVNEGRRGEGKKAFDGYTSIDGRSKILPCFCLLGTLRPRKNQSFDSDCNWCLS